MTLSIEIILASILTLLILSLTLFFIFIEVTKKELDSKLVKTANSKIQKTSKLDPHLSLMESHKLSPVAELLYTGSLLSDYTHLFVEHITYQIIHRT